jgi:hypothetical protein
VWRRRGESEEGIFAKTEKYPLISIHLWAATKIGFKSRISNFEETVNSDVYVEALESSGFLRMSDERFGERQWHFVQDCASCHTSASTLDALFEVCNVFPRWMSNSPDLNPIECLWGAIKKDLIEAKFQIERNSNN